MRPFDGYKRYHLIEDQPHTIDHKAEITTNQILVLCLEEDLTDDNKVLLSKILGAIGETMDSATIMSVNNRMNLTEIINRNKPSTLLSFRVNLNKNGLNLHQRLYEIIVIDRMSIIISESLSDLNQNKEAKMRLWNTLKTHFAKKLS